MKIKLFIAMGLLVCAGTAFAASSSLYETLSKKSTVAVYLGDFIDSTGQNKINPSDLKMKLDNALVNRKSLTFQIVTDRATADIAIDADVKGFVWLKEDPVDMFVGIGGTAMDAATVENYAALETAFTVTDVKNGIVLWSDRIRATLTKKDMSEEASLSLINEDMAQVFVRECFGKKRG